MIKTCVISVSIINSAEYHLALNFDYDLLTFVKILFECSYKDYDFKINSFYFCKYFNCYETLYYTYECVISVVSKLYNCVKMTCNKTKENFCSYMTCKFCCNEINYDGVILFTNLFVLPLYTLGYVTSSEFR